MTIDIQSPNAFSHSWIIRGASGGFSTDGCFSTTFAKIRSRFLYLYDLKASYSALISLGMSNGLRVGVVVVYEHFVHSVTSPVHRYAV